MLEKPLEINTTAQLLSAFDTKAKVDNFIHHLIQALTASVEDEYVVEDDDIKNAPVFFSNIEQRKLHINANWLSQVIIDFLNSRYDLNAASQSTLYQLFTSNNSDFDMMIRRVLFVEILGRKYGLMTDKQLRKLGRHDYYQETLFMFSDKMHFIWPSFTISTKRLQKFLVANASEYTYDEVIRSYKCLVYRNNEIVSVITSQKKIGKSLERAGDAILQSYEIPMEKAAALGCSND